MADLKSRFKSFMGFGNVAEDYEAYDEYEDAPEERDAAYESGSDEDYDYTTKDRYSRVSAKGYESDAHAPRTSAAPAESRSASDRSGERSGRILSMGMNSSLRVVLSKPTAFDNCESICSHLRGQMTVVLNLEYVSNTADRKRIFDFVSGCCYALDCSIQRVSDLIYVIAPAHVDVFAEIGDEAEETDKKSLIF